MYERRLTDLIGRFPLSFSVSKTMPRNRSLNLPLFFSTPTDHESIGPSPICDHSGGMGLLAGPLMDKTQDVLFVPQKRAVSLNVLQTGPPPRTAGVPL